MDTTITLEPRGSPTPPRTRGRKRRRRSDTPDSANIPILSTIEAHHQMKEVLERQQVRGRSVSPVHYSDNQRTRSQSPADSFYHSDSSACAASPTGAKSKASFQKDQRYMRPDPPGPPLAHPSRNPFPGLRSAYKYTPLLDNEIRLLRISPGSFGSHPMVCCLKIVPLDKLVAEVYEFQALSYAWGNDEPTHDVSLGDLPRSGTDGSHDTESRHYWDHLVPKNLYQALDRIRLTDDYLWLWVDYLCIEQKNQSEKSQQIPKMPRIYSSAWNVIAWLGDGPQASIDEAVDLIPVILDLRLLDVDLRGKSIEASHLRFRSWVAFGRILQRPWFRRRWVLQEVACARRLSVRIADKILSWLDFADAVDLFSEHFEQVRANFSRSFAYEEAMRLDSTASSGAAALMRFSRNVFQRSPDSSIASRLMSLESLVLTASPFAVSDVRDTIYALLYLANDMNDVIDTSPGSQMQQVLTSDYSKHPVDIFEDFVRYSIAKSNSLDVLYRQWANWPRLNVQYGYNLRFLPSWVGVATFDGGLLYHQHHVPSENFLGSVGSPVYHASHGVTFQAQAIPSTINDIIRLDGMLLGTVKMASTSTVKRGMLWSGLLTILGWSGSLDDGIDDQLWRTLVANRKSDSKLAPTWYRRACALALTQLNDSGDLCSEALINDTSQPSQVVEYLRRVQEATADQKIFRCRNTRPDAGLMPVHNKAPKAIVGLGPKHMQSKDQNLVCILYGSSVPVILRVIDEHRLRGDSDLHVKLVGPCYAHGHMEGEIFAAMSEEEIKNRTTKFSVH